MLKLKLKMWRYSIYWS